jgi:hypothetical protein
MHDYANDSSRYGDQGFLQEHVGEFLEWQTLFPGQVRSNKLQPPSEQDRIICYHGTGKDALFGV